MEKAITVAQEPVSKQTALSRGKKLVLFIFIVWAVQAVPKWTAAIAADDETSAKIVSYFIRSK